MDKKEIKPNKVAFFFSKFLLSASIFLVVNTVIYLIGNRIISSSIFDFLTLVVVSSILILMFIKTSISYKKEAYIFYENKIVHKLGGIFSDAETELNVKKITHVSLKLPFFENKIFRTGSIDIEAAGSGQTEIILKSINDPQKTYDYVKDIMKKNGFSLEMKDLILSTKPNLFAAFFETSKTFFGTIFIMLYLFGPILVRGLVRPKILINLFLSFSSIDQFILPGIIILVVLFVFVRLLFHFLDLVKRKYDLYKDTIAYSEGFLTKNYSFIPIENLADATLTLRIWQMQLLPKH